MGDHVGTPDVVLFLLFFASRCVVEGLVAIWGFIFVAPRHNSTPRGKHNKKKTFIHSNKFQHYYINVLNHNHNRLYNYEEENSQSANMESDVSEIEMK